MFAHYYLQTILSNVSGLSTFFLWGCSLILLKLYFGLAQQIGAGLVASPAALTQGDRISSKDVVEFMKGETNEASEAFNVVSVVLAHL